MDIKTHSLTLFVDLGETGTVVHHYLRHHHTFQSTHKLLHNYRELPDTVLKMNGDRTFRYYASVFQQFGVKSEQVF